MTINIPMERKTVEVTIEPDVFFVPEPKAEAALFMDLQAPEPLDEKVLKKHPELLAPYQEKIRAFLKKQVSLVFAKDDVDKVVARIADPGDNFSLVTLKAVQEAVVEAFTEEPFLGEPVQS